MQEIEEGNRRVPSSMTRCADDVCRLRCELTVVVVLGVFSVFSLPSRRGAYSVVHGPATVFQSTRGTARVHASIAQAALYCVRNPLASLQVVLVMRGDMKAESRPLEMREYNSVLPLLILIVVLKFL